MNRHRPRFSWSHCAAVATATTTDRVSSSRVLVSRHARLIACVAALVVHASPSHSEIIYSGTTDGLWTPAGAPFVNRLAQTFSTGTSALTLDSVSVWVRNEGTPQGESETQFTEPGTLSLFLYGVDGNKKPTGPVLLTILDAMNIASYGDGYVGGTNLGYQLAANTTYAVVFQPQLNNVFADASSISWKYNNGTPIVSSISPTPAFFDWTSSDSGTTWTDAPPTTGFNMIVTAVPEPSTYAMALTGTALAGWRMWRGRGRRAAGGKVG